MIQATIKKLPLNKTAIVRPDDVCLLNNDVIIEN